MALTVGTRKALLFATVAAAPAGVVGTPVEIASQYQTTNTTGDQAVTFTASASVGELAVLVLATTALSGTLTLAATDSVGNTWSLVKSTTLGSRRQAVYQSVLTNALTGGATTITANASASGRMVVCGFKVSGVTTVDVNSAGATGTDVASTISTGGQTTANQLIIGWVWVANTAGYTESTADSFTSLSSAVNASNFQLRLAYKIVSSSASVTYAPSGWGSAVFATSILSWKA